ncbi:MAG TPA: hypothetical protein VEB64_12000 [Azospirillaceae bacterium]|nr:hypothetical protein [Azospirillaceae bacterium]
MGRVLRSVHLRKDAQTPFGAIWSCFATPEEEACLWSGEIADREDRLNIGDIINVRPVERRHHPFSLRVTSRKADRVSMEKVRG